MKNKMLILSPHTSSESTNQVSNKSGLVRGSMELQYINTFRAPASSNIRSDLCYVRIVESSACRRLRLKWYNGSSDRCIHLGFALPLIYSIVA